MKIAVIGGGAAGFFAAIHAKQNYPKADVVLIEKSQKILTKVLVSGGGRCNVTNGCTSISELSKAYPRGGKKLKKAFEVFSTTDTMRWFESRGVPLIVEDDNRVFPKTEKSQSIISCLLDEVKKQGVHIALGQAVKSIEQKDYRLLLTFSKEDQPSTLFDKVIVASGGSPKRGGLKWLEDLNHKIVDPVPSLFTFNMPGESITELMGVVVENVLVNIQGTKLNSNGPLLVTHWGMSGPAILKLSAFGARILNERNYSFKLQVNWTGEKNNEVIFEQLRQITQDHAKKMLSNVTPFSLPQRMWLYLLDKSDLSQQKKWGEIGKKSLNKLTNVLVNDIYQIKGKTTFKEEFVTCGGVSLESVDLKTMQSKVCKNLYFAGEILDIDAITGGYNFQNAWTTGYIAGKLR